MQMTRYEGSGKGKQEELVMVAGDDGEDDVESDS